MPFTYQTPARIRRLDVPQRARSTGRSLRAGERELERIPTPPDTVDLTCADTRYFRPPDWAVKEFKAAVEGGGDAYTPYRGDAGVRADVAAHVADFLGVDVDPATQLILTPGTQAGLYAALAALVDEGDEVAVADPDYMNSERNVRYLGGVPRPVPVIWPEGEAPTLDLDALEDAFAHGARLFMLSHPNNPTGAVFDADVLTRIAELCKDADAFLIADQLYSRLLYDGTEFTHLAALPGMAERTLTTLGPSKTESMSGYRVGVAVAPPELVDRIEDVLSVSAIRCPAYAQHVLRRWLVDDVELVTEHVEAYQRNRDHAVDALNAVPGVTVRRSRGTSYLFPDISGLDISDHDVTAALRRAGLIVNPGYQSGFAGVGHIRICVAQPPEVWKRSIATMIEVLHERV